jgi:hypothetical protein
VRHTAANVIYKQSPRGLEWQLRSLTVIPHSRKLDEYIILNFLLVSITIDKPDIGVNRFCTRSAPLVKPRPCVHEDNLYLGLYVSTKIVWVLRYTVSLLPRSATAHDGESRLQTLERSLDTLHLRTATFQRQRKMNCEE